MARKQPEPPRPGRAARDAPHPDSEEDQLDDALDDSFPASDPPSIVQPDDGTDDAGKDGPDNGKAEDQRPRGARP
ncbi:MAG: hypothetical protein GC187_02105 [Alphaproteobacteria bacterium]|nr:hypothetical protein [Alphaproteobacteria bacterium]